MIYYICATELGWDKETVDKQPLDYIIDLVDDIIDAKLRGSQNNQVAQVSKLGMR